MFRDKSLIHSNYIVLINYIPKGTLLASDIRRVLRFIKRIITGKFCSSRKMGLFVMNEI